MRLLGIDWGEAKIGLAIAEGSLAEPWRVLRNIQIEELGRLIRKEKIDKVIIGFSEGRSGKRAKSFGESLRKLGFEVDFHDETLSTSSAQKLAREAKMKRAKARNLEDAFAAAIMLQSYLESHV